MSTPSEREAALRRALLSAAEQIEPAPGGLERIQARLGRPRPVPVAWLEAAWTVVGMRAPDIIEAARRHAAAVRRQAAKVLRLVWERFGPKSSAGAEPHRLSWLRPLVAMTVAVFVLGGGTYVALSSANYGYPFGSSIFGPLPDGGSGSTGPGPHNSRTTLGNGSGVSGSATPGGSTSPTCKRRSRRHPPHRPSFQGPSPSVTPSGTPSGSPSATPSTSPSPSLSGSSPPASGQSAASPAVEQPAGNASAASNASASKTGINGSPAAAGHSGTGAKGAKAKNPSPAASASGPTGNVRRLNPCPSLQKSRRHGKTHLSASTAAESTVRLTAAERTGTQPGDAMAAKLD